MGRKGVKGGGEEEEVEEEEEEGERGTWRGSRQGDWAPDGSGTAKPGWAATLSASYQLRAELTAAATTP